MKKTEIKAITEKIKKRRTATLRGVRSELKQMINDREKTRYMYFWTGNGNCRERSRREKYYNVSYEIEIYKDYSIYYVRHFEQSRACTYADDRIWDSENRKITIADLKKIITEIDIIIDRRTKAKSISIERENMALAG